MFGTLDLRHDELPIKGSSHVTYADLTLGSLVLHLTEQQLREVVECGINLLSDLNLGRLPSCDGSDFPPSERVA